ncbi:hypothetical protein [Actinokineospora pegani]|uniref:hypothetical protein n=1 Tax=Actinokineospora pegani TaxID=2654637 RepID=UPI0012EAF6DF|nr:hypothetical protein [Actinokineospora pegani]
MNNTTTSRFPGVLYGWADMTADHGISRLEQHWSLLRSLRQSMFNIGDAYADLLPAPATCPLISGFTVSGGLVDMVKAVRATESTVIVLSMDYPDLPASLIEQVSDEFGIPTRSNTLQTLPESLGINMVLVYTAANPPANHATNSAWQTSSNAQPIPPATSTPSPAPTSPTYPATPHADSRSKPNSPPTASPSSPPKAQRSSPIPSRCDHPAFVLAEADHALSRPPPHAGAFAPTRSFSSSRPSPPRCPPLTTPGRYSQAADLYTDPDPANDDVALFTGTWLLNNHRPSTTPVTSC